MPKARTNRRAGALHVGGLQTAFAGLAFWLLAASGCTRAAGPFGITASALQSGDEAVVFIHARAPAAESEADTGFVDCLARNLEKSAKRPLVVFQTKAFEDSLFPWFEPGHAPRTTGELEALMTQPEIRLRLRSLQIRFIVSIEGNTESNTFPGMLCGPNGCFGLYASHDISRISAVVLDVASTAPAQEVKTEAGGHTIMPAFVLPIPLAIAQTESKACDDVSQKLESLLAERVRGLPR